MKCTHCNKPLEPKLIAAHLGKVGGSKTSESKKKSSAANGLLGGRPKIYALCENCRKRFKIIYLFKDDANNYTCENCVDLNSLQKQIKKIPEKI